MTQLDIITSENAALRADTERQQRELEDMRERMRALEQNMNNGR